MAMFDSTSPTTKYASRRTVASGRRVWPCRSGSGPSGNSASTARATSTPLNTLARLSSHVPSTQTPTRAATAATRASTTRAPPRCSSTGRGAGRWPPAATGRRGSPPAAAIARLTPRRTAVRTIRAGPPRRPTGVRHPVGRFVRRVPEHARPDLHQREQGQQADEEAHRHDRRLVGGQPGVDERNLGRKPGTAVGCRRGRGPARGTARRPPVPSAPCRRPAGAGWSRRRARSTRRPGTAWSWPRCGGRRRRSLRPVRLGEQRQPHDHVADVADDVEREDALHVALGDGAEDADHHRGRPATA